MPWTASIIHLQCKGCGITSGHFSDMGDGVPIEYVDRRCSSCGAEMQTSICSHERSESRSFPIGNATRKCLLCSANLMERDEAFCNAINAHIVMLSKPGHGPTRAPLKPGESPFQATPDEDAANELLKKATIAKRKGKWEQAIDILKRALPVLAAGRMMYPIETYLRLPLYLQQAGRYQEALAEFDRIYNSAHYESDRRTIKEKIDLAVRREQKRVGK